MNKSRLEILLVRFVKLAQLKLGMRRPR